MGGSKKVTIGHRYLFGIHMGLWRGPVDAILQFKVGDRIAYNGKITGNRRIYINKPNLFGGDKKEGGIQGWADVMMGEPDQPVNSSLAAMLGGIVPAFRGVTTVFYDGLIAAMNPYPKTWAIRGRRILKGWDGPVFYPEKAQIVMVPQKPLALYFALDSSGSMDEMTSNGQTRMQNMKSAVNQCLDEIASILPGGNAVDIMIVSWGTDPDGRSSIMRRAVDESDVADLKSWVSGISTTYYTYFPAGVLDLADFYSGAQPDAVRLAFFVTDGIPSSSAGTETAEAIALAAAEIVASVPVAMYGINIDLEDTTYTELVDNTSDDGVPVVSGADPSAMVDVILSALGSIYSMNPAHIIYEAYTNRDWGRGLDPALRLDIPSFTSSADTFYGERFGMCIKWTRQDKLSVFVGSILDHVGASIYVSRRSGKLVLNPIRGDYDVDDLPLFTPDTGLLGIDDDDASADDKAVNCVVVKYRDPISNKILQVRARNLAAISAHGLNLQTTEYIGIPAGTLAARVAERDLTAYSSGVKKLKVRLDRRARDTVFAGGVFRISDPTRGIENLVLRAGRVEDGLLTNGVITVAAVKDVFGLPASSYVEPVLPEWTPPDLTARPMAYQRLAELSYRDLVRVTDPADMAYIDSNSAFLLPLAAKPTAMSLGYEITSRVGMSGEFLDRGPGGFSASSTLTADLAPGADAATLQVGDGIDLDAVEVGMAAMIDDEIMRVDAFDLETGAVTFGRGCADTVPALHLAGARCWFYEESVGADPTEYVSGSTVQAKLLTQTGADELQAAGAVTLSLVVAGRPGRPYPPGRLRLNSEAFPAVVTGDLEVAFAHRDRLLQADQLVDTTVTDIGPEPGVSYEVEVRDRDGGALTYTTSGSAGPFTIPSASMPYQSRLLVYSVRDGLRSWQAAQADFEHGAALWNPSDLAATPKYLLDDSSDVTAVSGSASQWSDRSGNDLHFIQSAAASRPQILIGELNGRRVLRFDGANDSLINTSDAGRGVFSSTGYGWLFTVYRKRSTGTGACSLLQSRTASGSGRFAAYTHSDGSGNKPALVLRRLDSDSAVVQWSPTVVGTEWAMTLHAAKWADGQSEIRVNGNDPATVAATSAGNTASTLSGTAIYIGSEGVTTFADIDLACSICGSGSMPSAGEINKLFGWAAWRYGLVDLLPAAHPYKDAPPYL